MALPGVLPKENPRHRVKLANWSEFVDLPTEGRPIPKLHGVKFRNAVVEWWDVVSRLPHTRGWSEGDWQYALDTALIREAWWKNYTRNGNPNPAILAELRRRDEAMGTTMEARRKLRIRYVQPAAVENVETGASAPVSQLADRRSAFMNKSE